MLLPFLPCLPEFATTYKLFVDDFITACVLAFDPQYVPSNGAFSLAPSYILRNVSSQLGIRSSLKRKITTDVAGIVISHEQYCERGSISETGAGYDLNVPLETFFIVLWQPGKD